MTFSIAVESHNGHFTAVLLGAPEVRVEAATHSQAIAKLRAILADRVEQGELLSLEVLPEGVSSLAGKYVDDPSLQEIRDEIYRLRDAERPQ
jgi:hypothetical protein